MGLAPENIAGMEVEGFAQGSLIAWDPGSNLIAMTVSNERSKKIAICILNPSTLKQHAILPPSEAIEVDSQLVSLQWSPLEQKNQLMAATKSGTCMIWSQGFNSNSPSHLTDPILTESAWHCDQTFQTHSQPVTLRWLEAPSPWRWPRSDSLQGKAQSQGIESPFGPHTVAQQQLPWFRPGTVACAAVMQNATFQVAWWARGAADVTFKWHQSEPLPLPVSGDVLAADVAVATSGLLRLLIVSQLEPSRATLLKISGDPTAFRPDGTPYEVLRCEQTATLIPSASGHSITSALFQPDSAGTSAILISEAQGSIVLASFREDAPSGTWSQAASRTIQAHESPEHMVRMCLSHDGASLLLSHPSTGGRAQLCILDSHSLEVLIEASLPGECTSLAASPNMCCAVTAHPGVSGRGCRLLIHDLPASSPTSTESADALALRVCWSFVRRTSTWDVLRQLAVRGREQPNLASELLARLDTALHAERYTQRPAYGMALNTFKLQLLAGMTDPTAKSICMDIWAKSYLQNLAGQMKLMCRPDRGAPESQQGPVLIAAEDAAALEPWMAWVEAFVPFLLGCMRRWVLARQEAGTEADKLSRADALPCVRLLPDGYFARNLCDVVALCEVACKAREGEGSPGARRAKFKELAEAVRAISAAMLQDQRAAGLPNSAQSEAQGAHLDAAKHAQAVFTGAYGLHYYRTLGGVRPVEAFTDASSGDLIAPLRDCKHWSDSDIEAAGRKLGLLTPIQSSSTMTRKRGFAEAASLPPLHLDEGIFCVQTPELVDLRLKRQRWQSEHTSALGVDRDINTRNEIDVITGEKFSWALQPKYVSVDGLCSTAGLYLGDGTLATSLYNKIFWSTGLSLCPVTGSSWQRLL